jgi:hypothetical protein
MGASLNKSEQATFSGVVRFRCPSVLPAAIEQGAARNLMTASEYIRRSVIERLKADGIDPAQMAGAA